MSAEVDSAVANARTFAALIAEERARTAAERSHADQLAAALVVIDSEFGKFMPTGLPWMQMREALKAHRERRASAAGLSPVTQKATGPS